MEKVLDDFFGLDAIASERAKLYLIAKGEESILQVIVQFYKRDFNRPLGKQLADLFGYFGDAALSRLMVILKEPLPKPKRMAVHCFRKLSYEPAGTQLLDMAFSGSIDEKIWAIRAIGYLGAHQGAYRLREEFMIKHVPGLIWDRLSPHLFQAFVRIAVRVKKADEVATCFDYIDEFYRRVGKKEMKALLDEQGSFLEIIFSDFKPVAADVLMAYWLKHQESFFRELGLKALGSMRLNRGVDVILKMAMDRGETSDVKQECVQSLAMIDSIESAQALKTIYHAAAQADIREEYVAVFMAQVLAHLADRQSVEEIFPKLLSLGGLSQAYALYNLGLLGFDENIWVKGFGSNSYFVRSSVALAYARKRGKAGWSRLLQMERESSHPVEKLLALTALIIAGYTQKKDEFLTTVYAHDRGASLRTVPIIWRREIVAALSLAEPDYLELWEYMAGVEIPLILGEITELENNFKVPEPKETRTVLPPEKPAEPGQKIFISYGWGGESERVVDAVCEALMKKDVPVVRDKIALGYKGNIREFMRDIGRGQCVIVVISDRYLKSDNCMFEMLELKKRGDLYKRIFPIVLEDARIYKESERLDYIIYWDKEIEQLNTKIKELSNYSGIQQVVEKVNQYHDIRKIVDEITDLLRNMNTLAPDVHQNSDFSTLISRVTEVINKDKTS